MVWLLRDRTKPGWRVERLKVERFGEAESEPGFVCADQEEGGKVGSPARKNRRRGHQAPGKAEPPMRILVIERVPTTSYTPQQ